MIERFGGPKNSYGITKGEFEPKSWSYLSLTYRKDLQRHFRSEAAAAARYEATLLIRGATQIFPPSLLDHIADVGQTHERIPRIQYVNY